MTVSRKLLPTGGGAEPIAIARALLLRVCLLVGPPNVCGVATRPVQMPATATARHSDVPGKVAVRGPAVVGVVRHAAWADAAVGELLGGSVVATTGGQDELLDRRTHRACS